MLRVVTCIFCLSAFALSGQVAKLETKTAVFSFNSVGQTGLGDTAIEYPKGSEKIALSRINFWVTGIKAGGDTFSIGSDVFSNRTDWTTGPAHSSANQFAANWRGLWKLDKQDIENHKKDYTSQGYVVPQSIASWPSAFNQAGFPKVLTPYVDDDLSNNYNPSNGDYPFLLGERTLTMVATDSFHKGAYKTNGTPLDITFQYFVLDTNSNRVYVRFTLCNRGNLALSKVRLSTILDGQIGNPIDDAMLSDSAKSMVAIKNGQFTDAIYGTQWPAVGYVICNKGLGASIYTKNSSSNVFGKASKSAEFYHYAHGMWLEGKSLTYGGSGVDGTYSVNYAYSGFSDTQNGKLPWVDNEDIGKRTAIASSEDLVLNTNECKVIDACFFLMENSPSDSIILEEGLSVLKEYNQADFTLSLKSPVRTRHTVPTLFARKGDILDYKELGFSIPAIYSLDGKKISTHNNQSIRVPGISGIYLLVSEDKSKISRLIVE